MPTEAWLDYYGNANIHEITPVTHIFLLKDVKNNGILKTCKKVLNSHYFSKFTSSQFKRTGYVMNTQPSEPQQCMLLVTVDDVILCI